MLAKKDAFSWTLEETQAFVKLKETLCEALLLTTQILQKPLLRNVMPQEMASFLF